MRFPALLIGALVLGSAMHAQAQEGSPAITRFDQNDWIVRTPEIAKVEASHRFVFAKRRDRIVVEPYVRTFESSTLTDFVHAAQIGGRVSIPFSVQGVPLLFEGEGSREATYKAQKMDVGRLRISHAFTDDFVVGVEAVLMQGNVKEALMFAPRIERDWAFGIGGHYRF